MSYLQNRQSDFNWTTVQIWNLYIYYNYVTYCESYTSCSNTTMYSKIGPQAQFIDHKKKTSQKIDEAGRHILDKKL